MKIRLFRAEDTEQVAQLFHDTVRRINIRDYSREQVKAWSPDDIHFRNWLEICSSRFTYVAEQDLRIIGFGELEASGHVDCFYSHHNYQRQGVGNKIYKAIENKALELNLTRLFTEASITAQPFFIKQGFSIIKEQQVACRGETFKNCLMEKQLIIKLC